MKPTYEELEAQVKQLAAESLAARNAVQTFCDVVGANIDAICELVGRDGVRVILAAMSATGNMPHTDAFLSRRLRNEAAGRAITNALNACTEQLDTDCVMDSLGISYEDAALRTAGAAELRDAIMSIARHLRDASTPVERLLLNKLREGKAGEVCSD